MLFPILCGLVVFITCTGRLVFVVVFFFCFLGFFSVLFRIVITSHGEERSAAHASHVIVWLFWNRKFVIFFFIFLMVSGVGCCL